MGRIGDGRVADQEYPDRPGDDIKVDASYAKGTTKNVIATSGTSPSFAMFGDSGLATRASALAPPPTASILPGAGGTDGIKLTDGLGYPWRVQSQLGPILVEQPVRQLLWSFGDNDNLLAIDHHGQGHLLRRLRQPRRSRHWSALHRLHL